MKMALGPAGRLIANKLSVIARDPDRAQAVKELKEIEVQLLGLLQKLGVELEFPLFPLTSVQGLPEPEMDEQIEEGQIEESNATDLLESQPPSISSPSPIEHANKKDEGEENWDPPDGMGGYTGGYTGRRT